MTPTIVHKRAQSIYAPGANFNTTSEVLRKFVKEGIAVCKNEGARKNRQYELTKNGMKIRLAILKMLSEPVTPKNIYNNLHDLEMTLSFNKVSFLLGYYVEIGLAECLNPLKKEDDSID